MIKDITHYPEMANPQLRPRYSGVASFFRTAPVDDARGIEVGVLGIPFDGGVTNRTGARHGPRAVREQTTLVRRYNQATGVGPFDLVRVADLGDAWLEQPYE
jgi:guanidinopropionase